MTHTEQYLSLREFWHPPAAPLHNRTSQEIVRSDYDPEWCGMPLTGALALPRQGWPAGVTAALRLLDAPDVESGTARLRRRWHHDDGETIDVARALDGLPCWQQPYRAPGGSGGRIRTLTLHGGANSRVSAAQIAWKAYTAVRWVDAHEEAGYRVAVRVRFAGNDAYEDASGWRCTVTVKAPQDPVDLSQIAAVLSAAAFRYYGFRWMDCSTSCTRSGRGHDVDSPPEAGTYMPAAIVSHATASRWLEEESHETDTEP